MFLTASTSQSACPPFSPSPSLVFSCSPPPSPSPQCPLGLASPDSFFNLVESLGADVIERLSFPDHYFFKVEEVKEILDRAAAQNAYLITTEKDIVKIRRIIDDPRLLYLEIQVDFVNGKDRALEIISQAIEN